MNSSCAVEQANRRQNRWTLDGKAGNAGVRDMKHVIAAAWSVGILLVMFFSTPAARAQTAGATASEEGSGIDQGNYHIN